MKMSFNEWYDWWLSKGIDKNGPSQREMGVDRKDVLSMCRFNDTGPYSLDNIYCASVSQNSKDLDKYKHKFSRKPVGSFNSIKEWCEYHGKSYQDYYKIKKTS